jgi:hypothetical protein
VVEPVRSPIQAVEIRSDVIEAARRRRRVSEAAAGADAYRPSVRLVRFAEDRRAFDVQVIVRVVVPLVEDEVWAARIVILATFASEVDLTRQVARNFARLSGLFLVWPYARTYLTELARMAGVSAPPLPLLLRTS